MARLNRMEALRRLRAPLGLAAILLLHSAIAFAAPTPSPGLDGILIKPVATGHKEALKATTGIVEGPFDAAKIAEVTVAPDAGAVAQALAKAGFVSGYGRTWSTAGNAHVFVEAVMAFTGAEGATSWLRQSEAADKADPSYTQAMTIAGIDTYYGAKLVDKVHKIYGDEFVFAKGNDLLLITYVSGKNDLGTIAATQTKKQFDATPATYPPTSGRKTGWSRPRLSAPSRLSVSLLAPIVLGLIGSSGVHPLDSPPSGHSCPGPSGVCVRDLDHGPPSGCVSTRCRCTDGGCGGGCGCAANHGWPVRNVRRPPLLVDGAAWRNAETEVPPAAQRSEGSTISGGTAKPGAQCQ